LNKDYCEPGNSHRMPHTLLLLVFLFVYDTGPSGTKELRVIYWKRPNKALSIADEKNTSLRLFCIIFTILISGLRLDREIPFTKNQSCVNLFYFKFAWQVLSPTYKDFRVWFLRSVSAIL